MAEKSVERILPQSLEAEQALLGALLTNAKALEKIGDFLLAKHFAHPVHALIFEAIQNLSEHGRIADYITVKEYLANNETFKEMGGDSYLMQLVTLSTTLINVADYGRQIFDRYLRRELIGIGNDVVNNAFDINFENDAQGQIELAEKGLYDLANEGEIEGGLEALHTGLKETILMTESAMNNPTGLSGTPTGITDLDKKMGGLNKGNLIIIAGRPAMGKSSLATCIAFNVAKKFEEENKLAKDEKDKKTVALFSLEMSLEELSTRILATFTHINSRDMRDGKLEPSQFEELAAATGLLNKLPLFIDQTAGMTINAIKTRARRLKREKGLGLIVIDYLQLLSYVGRSDNRVQQLSEITRALKMLAKELNVPVIVLSQLSRSLEARDNKRPILSDLRESGSIEQDADIVLFVYREIYYLEHDIPQERGNENAEKFQKRIEEWEQKKIDLEKQAEIIIAKNRHGSTGTANVFYDKNYTEFGDLAFPQQEE